MGNIEVERIATTDPAAPPIRATLDCEIFCGSPRAVINKIPEMIKKHTAITIETAQKAEITTFPNSAMVVGKAKTVVGKINTLIKRKILIKTFFIV